MSPLERRIPEQKLNIVLPIVPAKYIFTYSVEAYVARMAYDTDEPELSNLLHALMNLGAAADAV